VVNGELITPRDGQGNVVEPFIHNGTTFLPARAIAEALGQTVEWDGATQTVYIGPRPGTVQFLPDVAPAFQYDTPGASAYTEFSSLQSGGVGRFALAGVTYTDGMTFWGNPWAVYNLNSQFTSLSGVVGVLDDSGRPPQDHNTHQVRFFADGRMVLEIPIVGGMLPIEFDIDITGVNQLRIEVEAGIFSGFGVGIGNPVIE
jgi:hypothetical protein